MGARGADAAPAGCQRPPRSRARARPIHSWTASVLRSSDSLSQREVRPPQPRSPAGDEIGGARREVDPGPAEQGRRPGHVPGGGDERDARAAD